MQPQHVDDRPSDTALLRDVQLRRIAGELFAACGGTADLERQACLESLEHSIILLEHHEAELSDFADLGFPVPDSVRLKVRIRELLEAEQLDGTHVKQVFDDWAQEREAAFGRGKKMIQELVLSAAAKQSASRRAPVGRRARTNAPRPRSRRRATVTRGSLARPDDPEPEPPPLAPLPCEGCGEIFAPARRNQTFCAKPICRRERERVRKQAWRTSPFQGTLQGDGIRAKSTTWASAPTTKTHAVDDDLRRIESEIDEYATLRLDKWCRGECLNGEVDSLKQAWNEKRLVVAQLGVDLSFHHSIAATWSRRRGRGAQ